MTRDQALYAVVDRLKTGDLTTAEELSVLAERSPRSIYRFIKHLRRLGVPILGEPGIGYMLRRKEITVEGFTSFDVSTDDYGDTRGNRNPRLGKDANAAIVAV